MLSLKLLRALIRGLQKIEIRLFKIEQARKLRALQKRYDDSDFEVSPGRYFTRENRIVNVEANTTGWYDGLPFLIRHPDGHPSYTVDAKGRLYAPYEDRLDLIERL